MRSSRDRSDDALSKLVVVIGRLRGCLVRRLMGEGRILHRILWGIGGVNLSGLDTTWYIVGTLALLQVRLSGTRVRSCWVHVRAHNEEIRLRVVGRYILNVEDRGIGFERVVVSLFC